MIHYAGQRRGLLGRVERSAGRVVRKAFGLVTILAVLVITTCLWEFVREGGTVRFIRPQNLQQLSTWVGLFGILSLGQAIVIITGGIDLSVGSVVALVGIALALLLDQGRGWSPWIAVPACLGLSALIGLWHGISWNFTIWGLWHGLGLFINNRWSNLRILRIENKKVAQTVEYLLQFGGWLLTFNYVTLGWIWFIMPETMSSIALITKLLCFR